MSALPHQLEESWAKDMLKIVLRSQYKGGTSYFGSQTKLWPNFEFMDVNNSANEMLLMTRDNFWCRKPILSKFAIADEYPIGKSFSSSKKGDSY